MIYLYAAVEDAPRAVAVGPECGHPGLRVLRAGDSGLPCIVEDRPAPGGPEGPDELLDHDTVVRSLMAVGAVVPFRFGTVVADEAGFERAVGPMAAQIAEALGAFRGRVELALTARLDIPRAPSGPERSGRSYLRRIAAEAQRSGLESLHATMASAAVANTCRTDGRTAMKAAYLVDVAAVEGFCRLLEAVVSDLDEDLEVSLTGPWAPYSFVPEHPPSGSRMIGSFDGIRPVAGAGTGGRRA